MGQGTPFQFRFVGLPKQFAVMSLTKSNFTGRDLVTRISNQTGLPQQSPGIVGMQVREQSGEVDALPARVEFISFS